jgi:hypothetical protein
MVARLALDLQAMGLDPFTMEAPPPPDMSAPSMAADFNFALTPPEVSMARTLAGLPPLMQMTATLDLPPLGDPDAIPAMAGQLDGLAQLTPPHLAIPMPTLTKLAMVMNSLGKIEAAFDDPFSPATLERMETMLGIWSAFPLPLPLSSLALQQKLEALPAMEDIQLGEQIAAENSATLAAPFTPPSLPIMPFLNVTAALSASMQASLDMPVFDQCSACCCA